VPSTVTRDADVNDRNDRSQLRGLARISDLEGLQRVRVRKVLMERVQSRIIEIFSLRID
jgi:hypothetical protein